MTIDRIGPSQASYVRTIALNTWPHTFGKILSREQIAYMLERMYAEAVLQAQMREGHEFYVFTKDSQASCIHRHAAGFSGDWEVPDP